MSSATVTVCQYCGIESDDKRARSACVSPRNSSGFHGFVQPQPIDTPLVEDLIYRNYKYNRLAAPGTSPDQWTLIYGVDRVPALERRFQLDKERSQ